MPINETVARKKVMTHGSTETKFSRSMKKLPIHLISCSALIAAGLFSTAAEPAISTQVLFEKPKAEGEFRIPGILLLQDGTLLAFCADRKGQGDFGHDTTNVVRRSTDGGRTWSPIQEMAAKPGADIHSGPAVQDRRSGRIFKFMRYWPADPEAKKFTNTKTYQEMVELGWIDHLQTSDDSGLTWTEPQPIEFVFPEGVVSAATGNGVHGIQLRNGRLLIQAGYQVREGNQLIRWNCVFTSDDEGKTWQHDLDFSTAEIDSIREFLMAERKNGDLVFNVRSKLGWRRIVKNGVAANSEELGDIVCHAGLAVRGCQWFFSHPNPVGKARQKSFGGRRQRMCLRISKDEGRTWPQEIQVHAGAAAYSDVAILGDGTALVLFENGDRIGDCYQRISLSRIGME